MKKRILSALGAIGRFFAGALLLTGVARAQSDAKQWHVLIEPKFMHPPVSFPIAGAERTVLVPGYLAGDEAHYFSSVDFKALNISWQTFQARSQANRTTNKVKVEFSRGAKKVIEYASVTSESPLTATAVLSPDFLKTLADIFGPKVLVALPNRYTIFVFPALATNYRDYAPMIITAYHATPYPVSLEIFEVSAAGLRTVGGFEEP